MNSVLLSARNRATGEARAVECDANGTVYCNAAGVAVPVTIADGADVAQGATTDVESAAGNGTVIALLKRLRTLLGFGATVGGGAQAAALRVTLANDSTGVVDVSDRIGRLVGRMTNYDVLANGTLPAANATVTIAAAGLGTLGVAISGTWVGTIVAEGDMGDGVWDTIPLIDQTVATASLSTTVNGNFLLGIAGFLNVRIRMSLWTSGTATVYIEGSSAPSGVFLSRSIPTGTNNIGTIGTLNGGDVTQGAVADAAVITDANGTLSGKLRGLVKWAFERMPAALGQGTMAQSLPVAIASNQSAVPISVASGGDVAQGATTDAAASSTVAEDATARTGIGLFKGIKNILILINARLAAIAGAGAPVVDSYTSAVIDLAASTANQSIIAAPGANK